LPTFTLASIESAAF